MKLYLSSYKIGDKSEELRNMVSAENRRVGYIPNALDFTGADPARREQGINKEIEELKKLDFEVEILDLKEYFGKKEDLEKRLAKLSAIWVRGGNTFILRQAMHLSGFDLLIHSLSKRKDFVYAGYSAGVCVLAPDLKSLQQVDDPNDFPYKGVKSTIWSGLGILDYMVMPHYESDHPESAMVDKEIEFCKKEGIKFKPLRDGEVIIIR